VDRIKARANHPAMIHGSETLTYGEFHARITRWQDVLRQHGIGAGVVCGFVGDYTPDTCALMFALMLERSILVPFSYANAMEQEVLYGIAGLQAMIRFDADGRHNIETGLHYAQDPLVEKFRREGEPGLIVFSSGSTGKPKGILHSCERVAKKFVQERRGWRTILFLMMDHFGGFNTFLSSFAYGGVSICIPDRSPGTVCRAIAQGKATLLPTTPTFLNLLLASGAYRDQDLSSVELITYGTEVMSESTLRRTNQIFAHADVKQTYGLSELGVLHSKSEGSNSVWVKIGGDGFEVKVKDNLLYIRSEANMIGYLNAPNPFDEDGWFCTDDEVEVKDGYMRIIGRQTDMINVGGQKVFPNEVESVLLDAPNIYDAVVYGAKHAIMGNIVVANLALREPEDGMELKERLRSHCAERLAQYKIPVKFKVVDQGEIHSARFKKQRPKNEA
jgi:acyl-coenzyme A synthetase/AMP-(fatty) acid ligase